MDRGGRGAAPGKGDGGRDAPRARALDAPLDALGDRTDLPVIVFLFLAAVLAEHFRVLFGGC